MKKKSPVNRSKNIITKLTAASLAAILLLSSALTAKAQEGDVLTFMPSILAAAREARSCQDGVFANCTSRIGCRVINGLFENGQCEAKPEARLFAEQLTGRWNAVTSLSNGDYFNYFSFDIATLQSIRSSNDYALNGDSFISSSFSDQNATFVVSSFDSTNDDWFILDYWGTDIGTISIIEMSQTSSNQFDGCEFFVNFPDLTYQDGVCNPIRLRRNGSQPSFLRGISNIVSDLGSYITGLFNSAQSASLPINIASNRRSIDRLVNLPSSVIAPLEPIAITSPVDSSSTNRGIVEVSGNLDANINLDRVDVNGERTFPEGNAFSSNVTLSDGVNVIRATADYGRRTYSVAVSLESDSIQPTVVNAASTSSSSVVLQFSEPMSPEAIADASNFDIVRNDNNSDLPVTSVAFANTDNTAVLLRTGLQNNAEYTIRAVNVTDAAGNPISGPIPEVEVSLASAIFVGTRPTGDEIIDTDNDGIPDHVELTGYQIVIRRTDGSLETRQVSSDPFNDDPDNDGVVDAEERQAGSDPFNPDTDGDTLSDGDEWNRIYSNPVDQDTDRDGIQDGFEFSFFKTSPILADTDGDQIDDPTELAAGNRNPLVADLPSPDISIGNINLQLDTRFTITNSEGVSRVEAQTSEATLTQAEDETFSEANENSTTDTVMSSVALTETVSSEYNFGVGGGSTFAPASAQATIGFSFSSTQTQSEGSSRGATVSVGEESSRSAEEAFHDSLTTSTEVSTDETVTRDIVDGAVRVDLSIDNAGDIPFNITNLELTALAQDPNNRRQLIPVASLTPQNSNLESVNIGALGDTARGPFVFATEQGGVFPSEIEQLMKNPRGLIVQLANFDIVDEQGNNFAFTSQQVLDRTAGITFDLGDGRTENYRIATANDHDENTGVPSGITMKRALEIIGLVGTPTIRDGGNGRVDSIASGDDLQLAEHRTFVEPRSIIIEPGENGEIDTTLLAGDDILVLPNYQTTEITPSDFIIDGGNGIVETIAVGDDDQFSVLNSQVQPGQLVVRGGNDTILETTPAGDDILVPGGPAREVLTRFRDVEASSENIQFWVLFSQENVEGIDLNEVIVRSGQQYDFTFIQDRDFDGVWAREEYLHGSSDLVINTDGCDLPLAQRPDPCDTLTDAFEIQQGWRVQLRSSPQSFRVYSNPNQADSDRDGLSDDVEFACGLDPRQRDTDLDGLTDREEIFGIRISGVNESDMFSSSEDDPSIVPFQITRYGPQLDPNLPIGPPLPIENYNPTPAAIFVDHPVSEACLEAIGVEGFATDPLDADTDGDFVNDLTELNLGLHPNNRLDGADFLDDDGDGLSNSQEEAEMDITINGGTVIEDVISNPNIPDTDGDRLPDLLEFFLGSNPDSVDTDRDGLSDTIEYANGGAVCVGDPAEPCATFANKATDDYDAFLAACAQADVCNVDTIEGPAPLGVGNRQLGTNLNHNDTDGDGVSDGVEINGRTIRVNGSDRTVFSNPLIRDSDGDGLTDGQEANFGTDPSNVNTDGDSLGDFAETRANQSDRNPAIADRRVTLVANGIILNRNNIVGTAVTRIGPSPISVMRSGTAGLTSLNGGGSPRCDFEIANRSQIQIPGTFDFVDIPNAIGNSSAPREIPGCFTTVFQTNSNQTRRVYLGHFHENIFTPIAGPAISSVVDCNTSVLIDSNIPAGSSVEIGSFSDGTDTATDCIFPNIYRFGVRLRVDVE